MTARILTACLTLALVATSASAQRKVQPVQENLGPPIKHGPKPTPVPPKPVPPPQGGLRPNPQATANLFARLGLVGNRREATGKIYSVHANGARGGIMGSYKITGGRMMIFPAAVGELRLDLHDAVYNPATNVVGAKWSGINMLAGRNTGGGGINMSLNGSGPVNAEIQEWYQMVGNQAMKVNSPRQRIVMVPN